MTPWLKRLLPGRKRPPVEPLVAGNLYANLAEIGKVKQLAQELGEELDGALLDARPLDTFGGSLEAAEKRLRAGIGRSGDVVLRPFRVGGAGGWPALLCFLQGLTDNAMIDRDVMIPLQNFPSPTDFAADPARGWERAKDALVAVGHVKTDDNWPALLSTVHYGNTLLFLEGSPKALILDTSKPLFRQINRPATELAINGSQEAFTEPILIQITQVRRRIASPALQVRLRQSSMPAGSSLAVLYLEHVANPELVDQVEERLARMGVENLYSTERLIFYLSDFPYSPFPLVRRTERVDQVARDLLMGKVAVLLDGVPFALTMPTVLNDFFVTMMDYYSNAWSATLSRLTRCFATFIGIFFPAFYIAVLSVNPNFLPLELTLTLQSAEAGVPFPSILEVAVMLVILSILIEAGLRLPGSLNTVLGTAGAIVLGTAVVKAGIVSPLMLVIMTITAVALFTSPVFDLTSTYRIISLPLLFIAYYLGFFGLGLAVVVILVHLCSLTSFGVPYFSPYAPLRLRDMIDSTVRLPLVLDPHRPSYLRPVTTTEGEPYTPPPPADAQGQEQARRHS